MVPTRAFSTSRVKDLSSGRILKLAKSLLLLSHLSNVDNLQGSSKIFPLMESRVSKRTALDVAAQSSMAYVVRSESPDLMITGTIGRIAPGPPYAAASQISSLCFSGSSLWKTVLCLLPHSLHSMFSGHFADRCPCAKHK